MNADRKSSRRRGHGGFTLMEVLLVLVILVILGSIAVPMYISVQRDSYMKLAKNQVNTLETPLNTYRLQVGDFPSSPRRPLYGASRSCGREQVEGPVSRKNIAYGSLGEPLSVPIPGLAESAAL